MALPNFQDDYVKGITTGPERVYDPGKFGINTEASFMTNVKNMFYPTDV